MNPDRCPRCDSPLADGALAGQCPRCLGALAFGGGDGIGESPLQSQGDFDILRELGRGGIGIVYEAHQRSLHRRVAIKMLLAGGGNRRAVEERFRAEATAAARLRHPGIVAVHEVGEMDGHPYMAMERVAGPSLAELVRLQPLRPARAARYVRLVAEAIQHAHQSGVLHRDLKPSNVLIDENDHPRVTDFGLAKMLDSQGALTQTGDLLGSPNYLPPEQVAGGRAEVSSDLYSLGAILYELLTARPPFLAETVAATLQQVLHAEPVAPRRLNPAVPPDLETVCLKCLRKDRRARYASAADLAADLARFEAGEPVRARPVSRAERVLRWSARNPALAGVSIALLTTVALGLATVIGQWRRAESSRRSLAQHLYAADVAAAATALNEGNLGRARSLLRPHVTRTSGPTETGAPSNEVTRPDTGAGVEFTGRWLWSQCQGDELQVLGEHPWIVTCVAVSPDGRWLASGSLNQPDAATRCLRVWRLDSGVPSGLPGPATSPPGFGGSNTAIWSVAFTPDSRTLVTGGEGGVRCWDVARGEPRTGFPKRPGYEVAVSGDILVVSPNHPFYDASAPESLWQMDLATHEVRVLPIRGRHPALSPDGRRIAVLDGARTISLLDRETGRVLAEVATNHLVFRLRFSPDGRRLAAAGQMTAAKVWDLDHPDQPPRVFRGPHNVWDAAFTPDGDTLVVATSHQQVQVWDVDTVSQRGSLAGHDHEVWTVAVTPDGQRVVSGGKDRTVRLWELAVRGGPPSVPLGRHMEPRFSPDASRFLTCAITRRRPSATVWEMPAPGSALAGAPRALGSVTGFPRGFAPDGRHILLIRDDRPTLEWRVPETGATARVVDLAGAPTNLYLSEFALAGDSRTCVCPDTTGGFGRWSTEDGRRLISWRDEAIAAHLRGRRSGDRESRRLFRGLAVSRSGRWLAVGLLGTSAAVLADMQGGPVRWLKGHHDDIAGLAFSGDERWLATGSVDGTIRLWDVREGRETALLPGHLESVEAVAFSPDGRTLAAVSPGIEVTFWHLLTQRELARWPHPEAGLHLAFSADGRWLALGATAGNLETDTDRVELWEARGSVAEDVADPARP